VPLPVVDATAPPSLIEKLVTPFALSPAGTWFLKHVSRRVDPTLMRMSRGRVSTLPFLPVVLLTTTGARTGLPRTAPLLYFTDEGRVVLMASNYGGTTHPAWYHNVVANPDVTMFARGHDCRYRGQEAVGAERERLWELAKQLTSGYAQYEHTTEGRTIPVLVFTAVEDGPSSEGGAQGA
jgi:deazaflavin-dependent oxidoreductase (nitroreductase family)